MPQEENVQKWLAKLDCHFRVDLLNLKNDFEEVVKNKKQRKSFLMAWLVSNPHYGRIRWANNGIDFLVKREMVNHCISEDLELLFAFLDTPCKNVTAWLTKKRDVRSSVPSNVFFDPKKEIFWKNKQATKLNRTMILGYNLPSIQPYQHHYTTQSLAHDMAHYLKTKQIVE